MKDVKLPYFAYGLLKSNELAHQKIADFIDRDPEKAVIKGSLWVRDGLPLLGHSAKDGDNEIIGQILTFHKGTWTDAYKTVCTFEPEGQYRWIDIEISQDYIVNVRVGRSPERRSIYYNEKEWRGKKDPVFTIAMNVINERVAESEKISFSNENPGEDDWKHVFNLQMAYMLLWSAIERYCAHAYGENPDLPSITDNIIKDKVFVSALEKVLDKSEKREIYDYRNINRNFILDKHDPAESISYYWTIRNNAAHNSKGSWDDGEILRSSLNELFNIFQIVLNQTLFSEEDPD